jgi:hypothetical protein
VRRPVPRRFGRVALGGKMSGCLLTSHAEPGQPWTPPRFRHFLPCLCRWPGSYPTLRPCRTWRSGLRCCAHHRARAFGCATPGRGLPTHAPTVSPVLRCAAPVRSNHFRPVIAAVVPQFKRPSPSQLDERHEPTTNHRWWRRIRLALTGSGSTHSAVSGCPISNPSLAWLLTDYRR